MLICCLGDSLTEGDYGIFGKRAIANVHAENYPYFLQRLTGAEVKNYGKCGHTSSHFLAFFNEGNADVTGADLIIIMLGTNGGLSAEGESQGNADYIELIKGCRKQAPGAEIVICTPPHATENPEMSNCGYVERVTAATGFVKRIASEMNLHMIDLAACPEFTAKTEHIMQPNDGLHFGEVGYRTMANYIYKSLKEQKLI